MVELLLAGTGKMKKEDHRNYLRKNQIRATEGQDAPRSRPKSKEEFQAMMGGKIEFAADPKPKVKPKRA